MRSDLSSVNLVPLGPRYTETKPMMKLRVSKASRLSVVAKSIVNNAPARHSKRINGRRLTRSPNGEIRSRPPAYPAFVKDETFEILSYDTPNELDK